MFRLKVKTLIAAVLVATSGIASADPQHWQHGLPAKNLILLIGDGMGEAVVLATRYQQVGRDGRLAMDWLPVFGQVTTHSENSLVTDSAAASTAFATGTRTNNGMIAQTPDGSSTLDRSILMLAKQAGKSTGLVTEVPMAHATPASFAASVPSRRMMNEIAEQYLANGVDVILGGGESNFRPKDTPGAHCAADKTKRIDGRDLVKEATAAGYQFVSNRTELGTATAPTGRLLGLFACERMAWATQPVATEPTSAEKTRKAIEILARNPRGFFLMVERGKIDWATEANNAAESLAETLEFDRVVAAAMEFARADGDTLVLVTADHEAGGLHIIANPDRGPVEAERFDERGRTITPRQGVTLTSADGLPIHMAWTTHPGHTADPVGVRAFGPGAQLVWMWKLGGAQHLTDLYEVMRRALFLGREELEVEELEVGR
jgi:alkaline phosphatase